MKPCILFVDDQNRVLEGLRRSLRGMQGQWEMIFADSGQAALEYISMSCVDVIISDMRMPGMGGAELLAEVERRDPRVIRIILSGQVDKDMAIGLLGTASQFLSKPCDTKTMVSVVERLLGLRDLLPDDALQSPVSCQRVPPSLPKDIPLGARILKVLSSFVDPDEGEPPTQSAFDKPEKRSSPYDPEILAAAGSCLGVQSDRPGKAPAQPVIQLPIQHLRRGDRLVSDLETEGGTLVLSAGHELSQAQAEKVLNLHKVRRLKQPVLVIRRTAEAEQTGLQEASTRARNLS